MKLHQPISKFLACLLVFVLLGAAACQPTEETAPQVSISTTRVQVKQPVDVRGSGFTPKADAFSHLRRPDGSEYPVLPIFTNENGEFTHAIDTLLLDAGTHELWVIDSVSGVASNVARFEVVLDQ